MKTRMRLVFTPPPRAFAWAAPAFAAVFAATARTGDDAKEARRAAPKLLAIRGGSTRGAFNGLAWALAIACSAFAFSTPASATAVSTSAADPSAIEYTISLPNYAVTDIDEVNLGSFTIVGQGPYPNDPTFSASSPGPTTLTYGIPPILYQLGFTPGQSFLLGVATDLAGDAEGQQHLVLFTNDSFAEAAQGIDFGTLFPNTNEAALISDLETSSQGNIFNFAGGDAVNGAGAVASIAFQPGQTFDAVAFSDGQIIGSGTSEFVSATPEPSTWLLMFVGVGAVGLMLRRAKMAVNLRSRNAVAA